MQSSRYDAPLPATPTPLYAIPRTPTSSPSPAGWHTRIGTRAAPPALAPPTTRLLAPITHGAPAPLTAAAPGFAAPGLATVVADVDLLLLPAPAAASRSISRSRSLRTTHASVSHAARSVPPGVHLRPLSHALPSPLLSLPGALPPYRRALIDCASGCTDS